MCRILNLFRIIFCHLDKGMWDHGRMVVFISLSLVRRFDHIVCHWFKVIDLVLNVLKNK